MLAPGDYSLADLAVTTPLAGVAQTPIQDLDGVTAVTILARFAYGSGGTTAKAYVQVSVDDGLTWIDVACFAFTTGSATSVVNLSGLTPKTTPDTPTDGTLADNTCVDGVLGSNMRVKLTTIGTYANTTLSVKASAR